MGKRKHDPCDPAATIIKYFGGAKHVSYITGVCYQSIWKTVHPKIYGGSGGKMTLPMQVQLLDYAAVHRINLLATDFANADRLKHIMLQQVTHPTCVVCGTDCPAPVPHHKAWWMASGVARDRAQFFNPRVAQLLADENRQFKIEQGANINEWDKE